MDGSEAYHRAGHVVVAWYIGSFTKRFQSFLEDGKRHSFSISLTVSIGFLSNQKGRFSYEKKAIILLGGMVGFERYIEEYLLGITPDEKVRLQKQLGIHREVKVAQHIATLMSKNETIANAYLNLWLEIVKSALYDPEIGHNIHRLFSEKLINEKFVSVRETKDFLANAIRELK
jgi:hypothetical protein